MNRPPTNRSYGAFTLIEMLCVMGIIGILAALLLPALTRGKSRAQQVYCVGSLRETGIAFHSFAHDYQDRFPMQVPMSDGGSREFVRNGYAVAGEFYFSFRHFQVLSNRLGSPKPLHCPSDVDRLPAGIFETFRNENLSYFVGVAAAFGRPNSILAGDRNITNNATANPSIVQNRIGTPLQWTKDLHRFRGNLLFADGHVEELGAPQLEYVSSQTALGGDFVLPSVGRTSSAGYVPPSKPTSTAASTHSSDPVSPQAGLPSHESSVTLLVNVTPPAPLEASTSPTPSESKQSESLTPPSFETSPLSDPAPAAAPKSAVPKPTLGVLHDWRWLLYLLLLLLVLGVATLIVRQRSTRISNQ